MVVQLRHSPSLIFHKWNHHSMHKICRQIRMSCTHIKQYSQYTRQMGSRMLKVLNAQSVVSSEPTSCHVLITSATSASVMLTIGVIRSQALNALNTDGLAGGSTLKCSINKSAISLGSVTPFSFTGRHGRGLRLFVSYQIFRKSFLV